MQNLSSAAVMIGALRVNVNFSHLPAAVFSIFSLFFFLFHFQGLKILPMAANLEDFLSTGGVAVTEPLLPIELDFKLPFFFLSEKHKKMVYTWSKK